MSTSCPPCSNPPAGSQCCYNAPAYYYPDIEGCVNGWYTLQLPINNVEENYFWYAIYFDQCLCTSPVDLTVGSQFWIAIRFAFLTVYNNLNDYQIVSAAQADTTNNYFTITQGSTYENNYPAPPNQPYIAGTLTVPTQQSYENYYLTYNYVKLTNLWLYVDVEPASGNCTLGEQESDCIYGCFNGDPGDNGSTCCYYSETGPNSAVYSATVNVGELCGSNIQLLYYSEPYTCLNAYYYVTIPPYNPTTTFCYTPSICFTGYNNSLWLPMLLDGITWNTDNNNLQNAVLTLILTYWESQYSSATTFYNVAGATLSGPFTSSSQMGASFNYSNYYYAAGQPPSYSNNTLTYTLPALNSYTLNNDGTLSTLSPAVNLSIPWTYPNIYPPYSEWFTSTLTSN